MEISAKTLRSWWRDTLTRLSHLKQALRLVWGASKTWTVLWAILVVVQGLLPAALVYLTKVVVDALTEVVGVGFSPESLEVVLPPALLTAAVLLLQELLRSGIQWLRTAQSELVRDHFSELIHRKAYQVDVAFFENSENFDNLQRAKHSTTRSLQVLEHLGNLTRSVVALVGIGGVLIPYGIWVPLALLFSMVPAFYAVLHFQRQHYRWWKQRTAEERRTVYYDWLLTAYEPAVAEVRLFRLGPHLADAYQEVRRWLRGEELKLIRNEAVGRLAASGLGLLVTGMVLAWMVWRAMQGISTLGDIALFYQAFNQAQSLMRTLMDSAGQIYSSSFYLGHLFEYLDMEPQVKSPPKPVPIFDHLNDGIRLENVTFSYPGSERPVLKSFDLFIPAKKTVALVGPNGSGKSTLIKLLCRFYDPSDGSVTFDGVDARRFAAEDLHQRITVMFQFPANYQDTAARNIEVGKPSVQGDRLRLQEAAREAGAHEVIKRLPNGYDTQLGRWFEGGTQLSGGEWQRIALARAFYREAPIVLLDEPTSFMDSWAENAWLERFAKMARGRTALLITHRFTTAMRADLIYLMDEGEIVEHGTHEELLLQNGLYARSWHAQTRGQTIAVS